MPEEWSAGRTLPVISPKSAENSAPCAEIPIAATAADNAMLFFMTLIIPCERYAWKGYLK